MMSQSVNILRKFEKLIKGLNSLSIELQKDIIRKVGQRLIEYEKTISFESNRCKSTPIRNNERSDSGSDEMVIDVDTHSSLNVRKSKRLLNRIKQNEDIYENNNNNKQQISCNEKQVFTKKAIEAKHNTKNKNNCISNDNKNEEKLNSIDSLSDKQEVDENEIICDSINECLNKTLSTNIEKSEEINSKPKRKWRRAKDLNELKCKYCGKIWRSLSHLEIHLRSHTGEKKYSCHECGQRFVQLSGLQVHLRRHSGDRPFECEICQKAFYTKIDLTRHKSSHQELKQMTHFCEICGKGFIDNRKLKNHIRFVHEKKDSVVCEICGHKTHGQHLLYAHKRVKHGELTKHGCPVCNAVIGSRNAFIIHLRAHADVRPCACNVCGKQFRSTSQVARHKLAHREGRHECDVCLKKFKTPHHLRRHKVIHSGEKPFKCHLCDYRCNVNSNIVKHVKAVHGLINFSLVSEEKSQLKPGEEALEKGSVVAEEVLKHITVTKGEKMTLEKLKQLDQMKRKQKDNIIKHLTEKLNQRKKLTKNKSKKDILDHAIASTLNDNDSNTCNDNLTVAFQISETPINVTVSDNSMSEYRTQLPEIIQSQVIISSSLPSGHIYEIPSHSTNSLKPNLSISDEQHFKDVITLHFAN